MTSVDRLIASACFESPNENVSVHSGDSVRNSGDCGGGEGCSTKKVGEMVVECRICQEEDEIHAMEVPCDCNGSLKFAHRRCIQRWCNNKGDVTCEICNQVFSPNYSLPPGKSNPDLMATDIRVVDMDAPGPSRARSTASARSRRDGQSESRRRRGRQPEHEPEPEPEPMVDTDAPEEQEDAPEEPEDASEEQEDAVEVSGDADIAAEEEVLTGPWDGGPEDPSLLRSFPTHIAASIWRNQDRPPLKCHGHASKLSAWALGDQHSRMKAIVQHCGLTPLMDCSYRFANKIVVSAFVERWHPETNTFHMPFGEMTITLDDVSVILGIPVAGRSVLPRARDPHMSGLDTATSLLHKVLGVTVAEAHAELVNVRGLSLGLEWLRKRFSSVSDCDSDERVECAARAYMLYLLGCTLFTDKSGTRVSVFYLSLLEDLGDVRTYSWGAAALAFLYRQLGQASRRGVRQIAGYLTLLEAWIYEHFVHLRPNHNLKYTKDQPRVYRWTACTTFGSVMSGLQTLRELLDVLPTTAVDWEPYRNTRDQHQFHKFAYYTGCLRCMDIVEPYCPERVLRQFGRLQTIPCPPIAPQEVKRGATSQRYRVTHSWPDHMWERWHNHVLSGPDRSVAITLGGADCVEGYMKWYRRVSHLVIQNPEFRSGFDHGAGPSQISHDDTGIDYHLRTENALRILRPILENGIGAAEQRGFAALYKAMESIGRCLEGKQMNDGPRKVRRRERE